MSPFSAVEPGSKTQVSWRAIASLPAIVVTCICKLWTAAAVQNFGPTHRPNFFNGSHRPSTGRLAEQAKFVISKAHENSRL
jgi:hypothetical protein